MTGLLAPRPRELRVIARSSVDPNFPTSGRQPRPQAFVLRRANG